MTRDEMVKAFKTECDDHGAQIDPNNELDWFSLTVGWAIAKGLTADEANKLAVHIRYDTDLG